VQHDPGEQRGARFAEAREHLRSYLGQREHGHRKLDVAYLDMAAVAHTEMVIRNREAPSAQRVSLTAIESAALAVGQAFADGVLRGKRLDALAREIGKELDRRDLFPSAERQEVSRRIVSGMAGFVQGVCNDACPHHCFDDPRGDGRAAFYAEGLPWQDSPRVRPGRGRNEA
jgi:hypothetical protein